MDFKVGDKVNAIAIHDNRPGEVVAIGTKEPVDVCVRWLDGSIGLWSPSQLRIVADSLPTPPEGREVEAEMRVPAMGDMYFEPTVNPPRFLLSHAQRIEPRYCLSPLPPKPEGEGWEWRRPNIGNEVQSLNTDGEPQGVLFVYNEPEYLADVRLGYRWCRKKPKVMRMQSAVWDVS